MWQIVSRNSVCIRRAVLYAATAAAVAAAAQSNGTGADRLARINHIVVIYLENHSFDNLYGGWEGVNGRANADSAHSIQVGQFGAPYTCLLQNDVNLTSPPLTATCADATTPTPFVSHFPNAPFEIDLYIPPGARTCPQPGFSPPFGLLPDPSNLPGGCTRDLVHRFYQEQYQLNGGKQNRYTTGSDAVGLAMGYYDTRSLPIYNYLHGPGRPHYAIADNFFQSAFGGSFLNHQWLIAAATPIWPGAPESVHSMVDSNGMPSNYALYHATGPVKDAQLTALCPVPVPGLACGDYAVNTIQPTYQPFGPGAQLPPLTGPTIGDRLTGAGVDWAWYSGGWSNANGDIGGPGWTNGSGPACSDSDTAATAVWPNCPNKVFQYHHQPFNYFAAYAPGTAARAQHLRDEQEFLQLARASSDDCLLKPVSFIKPVGLQNEHPGYASETNGSAHVVSLLHAIHGSRCAKDTMVIATYDEFGGQWDHVPPPGQAGTPGVHDQWGPGTRIPALIVSPFLRGNFVIDHTQYDTTSILATIERRFGLPPLGSRDALVNDLSSVFDARQFEQGNATH